MVRHGESPKTGEREREQGLTPKGKADAIGTAEILEEEIEVFVSSPYSRAILTVRECAQRSGKKRPDL